MSKHTAHDIKNWFLAWVIEDENSRITKTKMMKLLYYAQGYSYAILGRPLFEEKLQAYQYGPVVKEVLDTLDSIPHAESLNLQEDFDFSLFSQNENQMLADVWETFGGFSSGELSDRSHQEDPWKEAWNVEKESEIDDSNMEQYFIEQRYLNFLNSEDGVLLERSLMNA